MKILIANPFGIGDVLFTTPLISNIKNQVKDAKIACLCNRRVKPLLEKDPRIYKNFVYEKDDFIHMWQESKSCCLKEAYHLLSQIKHEVFDCVFDFSLTPEFSFFFWLCGIKKRIGFNYKKRSKFLNKKILLKAFKDKHVIEYYLELLKFINVAPEEKNISIFLTKEEKDKAKDLLQAKSNNANGLLAAIVPAGGASWGKDSYKKHYPYEKFAHVADRLIKEKKVNIILLGNVKEKTIVENVKKNMLVKPLLAETNMPLREFMAVLSNCNLLLCNDGGPLHIAVGLGVPTVSIFGPVDEKVYGPYPPNKIHKVIKSSAECSPCYQNFKMKDCIGRKCLEELSEEEVFNACIEQLKI